MLFNPADYAEIQSTYPLLNIRPLTNQQERFLLLLLRGMSVSAAEKGVGYSSGFGRTTMENENFRAVLDYFRAKELNEARVTRDGLTQLLFEAHAKAANATEEVIAIREIGKMHDLYESDKHKGIKIQNNVNVGGQANGGMPTNEKQIERMNDNDLMRIANFGTRLEPVPVAKRIPETIDVEPTRE